MKDILQAHAEATKNKPLRKPQPDLRAAVAELQDKLAAVDGFKPQHDLRPGR